MRDLLFRETVSGTVGTVLVTVFFVFFTALVISVFAKRRKQLYEDISMLPFGDDSKK